MIGKVMFVCILHYCYSWKIRSNEVSVIQELKNNCTVLCPYQKETADLYADDITCESNCKFQHCVKGCNFLEKAFEFDCLNLCNITKNKAVKTSDLFCVLGCKQGLTAYFQSIKNEVSDLHAPALIDHTLSATSLSLEWSEPNIMNQTFEFVLQCSNVDLSTTWQFCQNQSWVSNTVMVEHLQPYTKYQFRVAIRLTPGDWYEIYSAESPIIATLPGGLPTSPPKILTATAVGSNMISVMWKEGQFTNGPIVSYILQISELPVGYARVKDIIASENTHAYMLQNLQPSKNYSISISARNTAGLGPPVNVIVATNPIQDKSKEKVNLMIATEHSVYSIASDIHDEPVLMYNTTHVIKGIALHVHRELLFISDSSGGVIVTSSKGLLTPQEVLSPGSSKSSALTADWLNDHLYILSEILHPSGSIVYQVARCALDGSNLIVVISGFIMKPHHIEVDPYNGYLFWVVRGIGLYRLDLMDISRVINHNVSPELIQDDPKLGAFFVSYDTFRIIVPDSQNIMNSISLDGQDIEKFQEKIEEPKFQNVISLAMMNGSLYWTNGERMYKEVCDIENKTFSQNVTAELSMTNCIAIVANTLYSQPIPVPLNPPTNFQAIFGHDIAKVSWDKPYNLAGQGEGAWSAWTYRLIILNKNGSQLFDFSDIKTTQFTVTGLKPGTEYALKVAAYTVSGEGPWSVEFRGKTIHRNTSLLWSKDGGLLISDVTGYRVTKIEPNNYLETDSHFLITDIDWFEDQVYASTNKQLVVWYNLTSNTFGRIQDINAADCISIEWLAKKIYWGNTKNKTIHRANLSGTKQEMLPIVAAVESLFLDSLAGYLYWSTRNTIEGACLDGTQRKTFYVSRNIDAFQIVGLALDIRGSELYWIERSSINPRRNALMITDTKQSIQRHNNDYLIDKFNLINQDVAGGLCYIDQHLVWVRSDDRTAMVSGLNGTTTALLQSESLSNLLTCTAMDPFIRVAPNGTYLDKLNVIPNAVSRSSIRVEGPYTLFNVSWDPISGVNYGKVFYRIKMILNEEETIMDVSDPFVTVGNAKAHVPLKISIQTWTLWAISDPVRVNLHSPTSTPSAPMNPRIFVMHKKRPQFQDKEVLALFRWSQPLYPNGIIKRYELSCWVFHGRSNSSTTTCSSNQISAKTLEFTLQNLHINKTYYFQVRACTEAGCGNWSSSVKTNLKEEFPIPKLLITTSEGLKKMDYDRKSFGISIIGTENAKDTAYDTDRNSLFWIEKKALCESHLDAHFTNTKRLATLKEEGTFLSYDWIAKHLYWIERNGSSSMINNLDLNRNEEDRHTSVLVQRNAVVENVIVSPMNSMLYWVEVEDQQRVGTLMKSFIDGSNVKEFFHKETTFSKNEVSSSSMYNSEEQEVSCNCTRSIVGKPISLYPSINNQYKLLWLEIASGYIVSSDLGGCFCSKIVKAASATKNGAPISITADFKKVYWLDIDEMTLYSAFLNEYSSVEKVSNSKSSHLKKIMAFGSHLQLFPDFICLWPSLPPGKAQMVKHSSDAITLGLPLVQKVASCNNISMATVEYTLYYGIINDDGTSNCTSTVKSCSQVVTFDKIKKVSKLKPYTRYVFFVGVNNYYSQMKSMEPVIGEPIIYRTAPGVPSPPRNMKAIPVNPYAVLVRWSPPEFLNAAGVRYSVFWYTNYDNGTDEARENAPWRQVDTSVTLQGLLPSHNYTIWVKKRVKTFPVSTGGSIPLTGYSNSENITVQTYPEPGNLTLINVTSYLLNISLPSNLIGLRFEVEFFDQASKKWETVTKSNNNFVILNGLFPLTLYKVRLKIWYTTVYPKIFVWDGFEFKTLGDRPSTPGIPALQHSKEDQYQIVWEPSNNYGTSVQTYSLEGKYAHSEQPREADLMDKYSNWTVYYNGTDNFWTAIGLKHNTKYIFRVRAKNEYGWSAYSEISEESELPNKVYKIVFMMAIFLALFCICGVITLFIFLQLYRRKSSKSKSVNFVKNGILTKISNGDFELVNLRELPSGTNFIKNSNVLYIPQNDSDKIDMEFSQMPRILREQITLTKFLGSGAFGEVYEGKVKNLLYENIETKVAIKALRKNATEQEKIEFLKEAELMNNFKHKHILQMLGICIDNNPNFIIMELMEGGDLLSYLRSNRSLTVGSSNLTFLDLMDICCDVASGCCYLEEMHFVHRDLACRNCLVSSKDPALRIVKIGDFGLARDIYKNDYYRKEGEGLLPVRWMAPESLVDGVFTRHSDVWSFGVLLWEVMSLGQQPYQARSNVEVLQYVRAGGRLSCPVNCPPKMYKLMETCWNFQPKERPTFKYCLKELEELKNDCGSSFVNLNYTTLLPITSQKDADENSATHSEDSTGEKQNTKLPKVRLCTPVEDTEQDNLLETRSSNLENLSPKS